MDRPCCTPPYSALHGVGSGSADFVTSIAVDNAGKAYLGGYGNTTTFPTTPGAFQSACLGCPNADQNDGSVAAFDPSQSGAASLVYSTYLGGNGLGNSGGNCGGDGVYAIAVDSADNAYVTGTACSADFPTTHGSFQRTDPKPGTCSQSYANAFLSKLNATCTALAYSTILGGPTCNNAASTGYAVSVNSARDAFVTGYTTDSAFPTMNPLFPANQYANSAFVTEFNPQGSALLFSTLLGTCNECGAYYGYGLHADNYGNIYVAGQANQNSALAPTTGAFQTTFGGGADDAFAVRIALTQADLSITNSAPATAHRGTNFAYTIVVQNNGPNTADSVTLLDTLPTGTTFVSAVTNAGSCTGPAVGASSGRVTCTLPSLSNGIGFTVTMTVRAVAPSGTHISDTASVSSLVFDSAKTNNAARATTTVN